MLSRFVPLDPREPDGAGSWSSEPADLAEGSAIIRWRQLPFLSRYRRKQLTADKVRFEPLLETDGVAEVYPVAALAVAR